MLIRRLTLFTVLWLTGPVYGNSAAQAEKATDPSSEKIHLGKALFNDASLSLPAGQSCASCHAPNTAFADPASLVNSVGANGRFGPRNTPSILYANAIPPFAYSEEKQAWLGGQFWDGRVDTLAEQAVGPLLDPAEMNATAEHILSRLKQPAYASTVIDLYGETALTSADAALNAAGDALQAFQQSTEFAPRYTSKYDAWQAGKVELTPLESRGNFVFQDSGMCLNCHRAFNPDGPVMFTDWTFHNLGVPSNPAAPFIKALGADSKYIDEGLFAHPRLTDEERALAKGKFRTPSLRNIALTAPYMHNGVFKTLREVVEFYNSRDVSDRWGPPEIKENMNTEDMGNLKLPERDIEALVAFMKTLTDGYVVPEKEEKEEPEKKANE